MHDVLFIVNPAAGGGRAASLIPRLGILLGADVEIRRTQGPEHASQLATTAAEEGRAAVVGVGGDGTLQEIARGLLASDNPPVLGIIPAGAGNDLAKGLGIPSSLSDALHTIHNGKVVQLDVGRCGDRYFLNAASAGFDAEVAASVSRSRCLRQHRFVYAAIGALLLARHRNRDLELHLDGTPVARRALLVAVTNGRYYGGGMEICPAADPTDGYLDVCVAGDLSRVEALALLPRVYSGGHRGHAQVEFFRARHVSIEGPPDTPTQLDGEIGGPLPAEFEVVPHALRVLVP